MKKQKSSTVAAFPANLISKFTSGNKFPSNLVFPPNKIPVRYDRKRRQIAWIENCRRGPIMLRG